MNPSVKHRMAIEQKIVSLIVADAIEQGYSVRIDNGDEEYFMSQDYDEVMRNALATDEEVLGFYKDGNRVGSVWLVYGNDGWDAICDHTDNTMTHRILSRAEAYALAEEE